jgi:anti-sigma B factor antagonist
VQAEARSPDRSRFAHVFYAGWTPVVTSSKVASRLSSQPVQGPELPAGMCARPSRYPGKMRVRGRWARVPDNRNPLMINGVAVVSAPMEIDIVNAEQLRMVLLEAARRGHGRVVVDMSSTLFCDSAGFSALVAAHKRALAEGGELRLVIPASSRVLRTFTMVGLDRFIRRFGSLEQALVPGPAAAAN